MKAITAARRSIFIALTVAILSAGSSVSAQPGSGAAAMNAATPEELLRPYFARLERELDLPQANPGKALDTSQTLTRLAFGSCNSQYGEQSAWSEIIKTAPQLFLALGDNVYGDWGYRGEADLESFRKAYAVQAAHPEFRDFRKAVPVAAMWDDHDFGPNDAGGRFAFREFSEVLFEKFWHVPDRVRSRPGIYDSFLVGPAGRRVQVIMLDTRFFRSALKLASVPTQPGRRGPYDSDDSLDAELLGEAQWAWLDEQLKVQADLRVIASSIQILTDAHHFEKWGNLPRERRRLMQSLSARSGGGVVLLSGDRHFGAIYAQRPDQLGEDVFEISSSSLNRPTLARDIDEEEPDALRVSRVVSEENFGLVDIDWSKREATLRLMSVMGGEFVHRTAQF